MKDGSKALPLSNQPEPSSSNYFQHKSRLFNTYLGMWLFNIQGFPVKDRHDFRNGRMKK